MYCTTVYTYHLHPILKKHSLKTCRHATAYCHYVTCVTGLIIIFTPVTPQKKIPQSQQSIWTFHKQELETKYHWLAQLVKALAALTHVIRSCVQEVWV